MADNEILLIEDNPDSVRLTLGLLAEYRLANNIKIAYDGAQALEMLFTQGETLPQLILLDLTLPKVSGLEVLAEIRAQGCNVPVLALIESNEDRDGVERYALGVSGYIVKPVDFEQFCRAMKEIGFSWLLLREMPGI